MPGAQDATPSWSGYIFQGEVALCMAIETINELGEDLEDDYCLKLEENEDFSLTTDKLKIFQVKAYTAHRYDKYREAWDSMMNRFPNNSENNYLYLQKANANLQNFEGVQNHDRVISNVISGEYSLENINIKIDDAIRVFLMVKKLLMMILKLKEYIVVRLYPII